MSTIVIGLSLGMLLFLLAAGLTLIFGMLGVINFAHGAIYMLGAYVSYETGRRTG
jgi:branched-chain amino acid transport system permease protein